VGNFDEQPWGISASGVNRSTGDPTRWRWQFPNGTVSVEQNPVLDMEGVRPGDVTLTVWRGDGSDSDTRFFFPDHC
jgi:PKD repeat protein